MITIEVSLNEIELEPEMDKIRVMIIDEHGAVRRALTARLDSYSQVEVVAAASTFSEGLDKARLLQPDIILLELKSEGVRRPEHICEMVDATASHPTGIIVLTTYADDDEREAVFEAGARRYLVKHIDSGLLVAEIQAVASEVANQVG